MLHVYNLIHYIPFPPFVPFYVVGIISISTIWCQTNVHGHMTTQWKVLASNIDSWYATIIGRCFMWWIIGVHVSSSSEDREPTIVIFQFMSHLFFCIRYWNWHISLHSWVVNFAKSFFIGLGTCCGTPWRQVNINPFLILQLLHQPQIRDKILWVQWCQCHNRTSSTFRQ